MFAPDRALELLRASSIVLVMSAVLLALPVPIAVAGEDGTDEVEREVIDMTPDDKVGWSLRNVAAPLTAPFRGGLDFWYKERRIEVDTTPSGGFVDLFYVRRNFQKRFEQAQTPVTVILPPRIEAGPRDALTVRAFREGYRQQRVSIPVNSKQDEVLINLEPLPNILEALSYRYFAGRSTLSFLTKESPTFRIQESKTGFTLILSETAKTSESSASLEGISSPMLARAFAQQLGEDLVVKVEFAESEQEGGLSLRSRQGRDAARGWYVFNLDIVPAVGSGGAVAAAKAALSKVTTRDVSGCAMSFDSALREDIGVGTLSRALTPSGSFTDPYLRAAMRRLGEISARPGGVHFVGGAVYDPTVPIELEVALSQAAEAEGFLALLRRFVAEMEAPDYQRETFRGLIAPELDPTTFEAHLDAAEKQRRDCLASR